MAYIITKKNGKPYKLPGKPTARDIPLWSRDDVDGFSRDGKANGDCWTLTNVVTRRSIHVGACKRETPADLWGHRRHGLRDATPAAAPSASAPPAQKPAPAQVAGFLDKIFGKKKTKRHPMSKRVYFVPGRGESPMHRRGELVTIGRARRRKRRKRR